MISEHQFSTSNLSWGKDMMMWVSFLEKDELVPKHLTEDEYQEIKIRLEEMRTSYYTLI